MMKALHRKMRRARAQRDGFTLVEILVVLFVLTVGILPLAMIQHRARSEVTESDLFTQGISVAQDQLERAKGLGFGNAVNDTGLVGTVAYVTTVSNVDFGLDRIEVTVTWQDKGQATTLTVSDLVSMR